MFWVLSLQNLCTCCSSALTHLSSPSWEVIHSRRPFLTPKHKIRCLSMGPCTSRITTLITVYFSCIFTCLSHSSRPWDRWGHGSYLVPPVPYLFNCVPASMNKEENRTKSHPLVAQTRTSPNSLGPYLPSTSLYQIDQVTSMMLYQ